MSATDKAATTEVENSYTWPEPRLHDLGALLISALPGLIGPDGRCRASVWWEGPPTRRKSFDSLAEWVAALAPGLEGASVDYGDPSSMRHAMVWADGLSGKPRLRVQVTVPDGEIGVAGELLHRMESELSLVLAEPVRLTDERTLSFSQNYILSRKPADGSWLTTTVTRVLEQLGSDARCRANVHLASSRQVERKVEGKKALLETLARSWSEIAEVSCILEGGATWLELHCDFDRHTARLHVSTSDEGRIKPLADIVQTDAPLTVETESSPEAGLSREYYARKELDQRWLEEVVAALGEAVPAVRQISAHYVLIGQSGDTRVRHNLESWKEELLLHWSRLHDAYLWLDARSVSVTLRFEPRRDFVSLQVEAASDDAASGLLHRLEERLELEPARGDEGIDPSRAEFEVKKWRNALFAEAVEEAVDLQFSGRAPLVRASVENVGGDRPGLVRYQDLEEFLARARDASPYGEVALHLRGSRDSILELTVSREPDADEKGRTIHLWSTLGPEEFPNLEKIFYGQLGRKKTSGIDPDGGGDGKKRGENGWAIGFRGLFFSVVGTLVVSSSVWLTVLPRHELEISAPAGGDTVGLTSGTLPVEWVVTRTRFGGSEILRTTPALVIVRRRGEVVFRQEANSGVRFPAEPNAVYDVEVAIDEMGERESVRVVTRAPVEPAP